MTSDNPEEPGKDLTSFKNIEFTQVRYTDVPGRFLAKYIANDDDHIPEGISIDGSSVRGFATIDESDLLLVPDTSTIRIAPISKYRVATVIADVYDGFGRGRLSKDPRRVTQLLEKRLANEGLSCYVGPEVECFIFDEVLKDDRPGIRSIERTGKYPIRNKGGYDVPPFQDSLIELRFEIAEILKKNHLLKITNLSHEVGSCGQIEINFSHNTITRAADNVQIYKDTVKSIAKKHDKVANFMPKPVFDENDPTSEENENGSGMHVSISLWAGQKNIFFEEGDSYAELSQAGRYFIGGVLSHSSSLAALVAPTLNSYHRIVPGFEAPVYITWSRGNRSAIVRVPINKKNNPESKRIEFRASDPSANPYLAFPAIITAGLDGIRKKIDPGDPIKGDVFKMPDYEKSGLGIRSLPRSLQESLDALKSDKNYLKSCFHDSLLEVYISLKLEEIAHASGSKDRQFLLYHDT